MSSNIKAILFDKDGTLLDFDATWSSVNWAVARFAAENDPLLTKHFLTIAGMDPETGVTAGGSLFAAGNAEEIAYAWIAEGAPFELPQLSSEIDRISVESMDKAVILPNLVHAVPSLKETGFVLGVASSDSEASIAMFLKVTGLTDCFSFIAGYDSGYGHKPGPGMVDGFVEAVGIPVHQVAVVGDNTHDLEMAHAAGAGLKVGVLSGTGTREVLSPLADIILESAADLPQSLSSGAN